MLKLIALVLPLGLDTFVVSAAMAAGGLSRQRRLRASLLFTAFEAGMPLVGLAIGRPLGTTIGSAADYIAVAILVALGVHMLIEDETAEAGRLGSALDRGGLAAVALGISISLDELAIGFTFGLLRLPVLPALLLIAAQAFVVSQLGMRLGRRIGERARERAERMAGAALALLGIGLLVARLAG